MRATDEESASKQRKDLAEPLIANGASAPKPGLANSAAARRSAVDWDTVVGMAMVTSAALLFGVVAAFVKACSMPTLVMLQCRSIIEWFIGIAVAIAQLRGQKPKPMPQADARAKSEFSYAAHATEEQDPGLLSPKVAPATLKDLLIGPRHLWGWLVLRGALYWGFLACWWLALTSMPIGDATTIVYTGPIFTATFARIFLGERIHWSFGPVMLLDLIGLVLITQPSFFFPRPSGASQDMSYLLGACSSLTSAIIAGLLPVTTRVSKSCFWTAVNHVSSALSMLAFTPAAFVVWFSLDDTAWDQTASSLSSLDITFFDAETGGLGKLPCLLGATVTGFVGLALQTLGYQRTEASKASVMTILEIPFAYLMQSVLFHDEVNPLGLAGVGFVMVGTVLNLLRHMKRS